MKADNAAEQAVLDFFATLGRGDLGAVRQLFHPDVTWTVMARGIPGSGVHRGAQAILDFIGPVRELFAPGSLKIEFTSMASKGSLVIVENRGSGQLKDGRDYDNFYVAALEVKDGLIYAIREYLDSYYVHTLFSESRPAPPSTGASS